MDKKILLIGGAALAGILLLSGKEESVLGGGSGDDWYDEGFGDSTGGLSMEDILNSIPATVFPQDTFAGFTKTEIPQDPIVSDFIENVAKASGTPTGGYYTTKGGDTYYLSGESGGLKGEGGTGTGTRTGTGTATSILSNIFNNIFKTSAAGNTPITDHLYVSQHDRDVYGTMRGWYNSIKTRSANIQTEIENVGKTTSDIGFEERVRLASGTPIDNLIKKTSSGSSSSSGSSTPSPSPSKPSKPKPVRTAAESKAKINKIKKQLGLK